MEPFARIAETQHEMSDRARHLRLLARPAPGSLQPDAAPATQGGQVALLYEWRAAQIARSKAMHPTNLARALALPVLRPLG